MENTSHWQLPLPTYCSERERPRKRPYSEAAECLGQPGERFNLAHYVCAHLSSFGPKELPHDGEVEASIVLSQKLGELRGHNSKVQTSCRGHNSKVTVLAMCNLKSCVQAYKYICADGCPSSAR